MLVTLLRLATLRERISSHPAPPPPNPGSPSSLAIRGGTRPGLLGICPRLFLRFLWEKIQKKTKSVPVEREGVGWDRALPCCPQKPQGPTTVGTVILLSVGPGQGWPGQSPLRPPGPRCVPGQMQLRGKLGSQILAERLARSQAMSTGTRLPLEGGQKSQGSPTSFPSSMPVATPNVSPVGAGDRHLACGAGPGLGDPPVLSRHAKVGCHVWPWTPQARSHQAGQGARGTPFQCAL